MVAAEIIEKVENCFAQLNTSWDEVDGIFDDKEYLITGEAAKAYIIERSGQECLEIYLYLPAHIIALNVFDQYVINVSIIPKKLKV